MEQEKAERKKNFNPRSPCGERPLGAKKYAYTYKISIHAPRVGSDKEHEDGSISKEISIHAPRVGSDVRPVACWLIAFNISIHAPRVGSDNEILRLFHGVRSISIHAPRVGSDE